MKLDIYIKGVMVGVLDQTGVSEYVFTYLPDASRQNPVSLLMPVRSQSWISSFLHPVFQISLPEGALRQSIERHFAKHFERFGDTELLAVVGENLVGQLQAVPHGQALANHPPSESLASLLDENVKVLVQHYLGDRLNEAGVSGGFLKFLARSPIDSDGHRATLAFDQWIVKLNDDDHPNIVLLEYFGMMAAREMGLSVPTTHLSHDQQRLLVQRFDRDANAQGLGFEDMCALHGLPAREKFTGSVERIIKTLRTFCPGLEGQRSCEAFYAQYLLASTLRNGDAHLKNFGLLYSASQAPTLSPVYDMLSMSVYAPKDNSGDAHDAMALTFGGTKRWLNANSIQALAAQCLISSAKQKAWANALSSALLRTADAVMAFQALHPHNGFSPQAARMLTLWGHGMNVIDPGVAQTLWQKARQLHDLS